MKRKNIIRFILILLFLLTAAALFIFKEYNRTHKDTANLVPDFSVTAISFIKDFESDEQVSNKKYWDKVIQVEGTVKDINKDERGFFSVILGDTASLSSVRCSMDSTHNNEAGLVQKGRRAIVKGICAGFNADEMLGSDVILVR